MPGLNLDSRQVEAQGDGDRQEHHKDRCHQGDPDGLQEESHRIAIGGPEAHPERIVGLFEPHESLRIDEAGDRRDVGRLDHFLGVLGRPVHGPDEKPRRFPPDVDALGLVGIGDHGNRVPDAYRLVLARGRRSGIVVLLVSVVAVVSADIDVDGRQDLAVDPGDTPKVVHEPGTAAGRFSVLARNTPSVHKDSAVLPEKNFVTDHLVEGLGRDAAQDDVPPELDTQVVVLLFVVDAAIAIVILFVVVEGPHSRPFRRLDDPIGGDHREILAGFRHEFRRVGSGSESVPIAVDSLAGDQPNDVAGF
eukprot:CAMPEP_0201143574 /NCGR_PEP_ID=MMETSP0851-20130426/5294_1 /ASSEMBLY_ACC=CAM_ASM_000631 /TAXON_ID=183588 /ORGANISM="Pseudo-nitzschia fraudulenta, Strain WWA7" /LENGTH=304 /DNA_ID=CAMNT_0047417877 /DNA_START=445 /DNA_END=1356 /DNA_ORIENTATION=+